jgi:hypothetical protein
LEIEKILTSNMGLRTLEIAKILRTNKCSLLHPPPPALNRSPGFSSENLRAETCSRKNTCSLVLEKETGSCDQRWELREGVKTVQPCPLKNDSHVTSVNTHHTYGWLRRLPGIRWRTEKVFPGATHLLAFLCWITTAWVPPPPRELASGDKLEKNSLWWFYVVICPQSVVGALRRCKNRAALPFKYGVNLG